MTLENFRCLFPAEVPPRSDMYDDYKVEIAFSGSLKALFPIDDVLISENSGRVVITLGLPYISDRSVTLEEAVADAVTVAPVDDDFAVEEVCHNG